MKMKRYTGVRQVEQGVYEINYRPYMKAARVFKRIRACSMQEAYQKRAEEMVQALKQQEMGPEEKSRLHAGLPEIWDSIHRSLLSENRPKKTIQRYRKTFNRLLVEFRVKKFPESQVPNRISSPFMAEYKNYYCVDLNRQRGWRAELIIIKATIKRLQRLGYCDEKVVRVLSDFKRPKPAKKSYHDLTTTQIRELFSFIKNDRPDYYKPLYFVARTGRRIEETLLIQRGDLSWEGISPVRINIRAETTKTREEAPLETIDSELAGLLQQANREGLKHKAAQLFLNRQGKKCSQTRIRDYLKAASVKVLGVEITPHYFRHRFFTECGKNNIPMTDAMAISGLKDTSVLTRYYSHSTAKGRADVLEKTLF